MRLDKALLVAKKDWKEAFSSKAMLASLVLSFALTVAVSVLLTAVLALGPDPGRFMTEEELAEIRAILPEASGMTVRQLMAYMVGVIMVPFLFMTMSLAATSILTADSFAGERERKTIEPLLAAPISDSELFLGKVLASFLPTLTSMYVSFGLTCLLINMLTVGLFGCLWFPPLKTALMVCVLTPAYAFLGMCIVVLGSARASTVKDASNYAAILFFPLLAVFMGQVFGSLIVRTAHLLLAAIILVALDFLFVRLARHAFSREALIVAR